MPSMDALAQHADSVRTRGLVTDLHFNSIRNKDELIRLRRRYRGSNAVSESLTVNLFRIYYLMGGIAWC